MCTRMWWEGQGGGGAITPRLHPPCARCMGIQSPVSGTKDSHRIGQNGPKMARKGPFDLLERGQPKLCRLPCASFHAERGSLGALALVYSSLNMGDRQTVKTGPIGP